MQRIQLVLVEVVLGLLHVPMRRPAVTGDCSRAGCRRSRDVAEGRNADPSPGKLTRSEVMARVRSKDTTPEMAVRRTLHAAGLRFRLHRADLPGRPDIVLPGRRAVVFVHGCFWHSHPGCKRARLPATRREYWVPKLLRNVERDQAAVAALHKAGWRVFTAWECETRSPATLAILASTIAAEAQHPSCARSGRACRLSACRYSE